MLPTKKSKHRNAQEDMAEPTKILHLTHTDIPSDNRILKEIVALADAPEYELYGFGIRLGLGGENSNINPQARIESLQLLSRRLTFLPLPIRHLVVGVEMSIRLLLMGMKVRPDVVHCHDAPVLIAGVLLKHLCRAKLVYDAHELESNKNAQSRLIAWLTLRVERFVWPFIDHLISVSPSILKWYEQQIGPKPNSLVLNSPFFVAPSAPSDEVQRKPHYFHDKFDIPKGAKVFLYLGLLVSGRGIEKLLKAFSNNNASSHLVFLGYGPFEGKIQAAAKICPNIHLHPPVPHEEVVATSRSADVGLCIIENVSLSDYYCLPNKLFEYAFAGIPVLASNFPDIDHLVSNYGLGECCAVEVDAIAEAIGRIERSVLPLWDKDLRELGWQSQTRRLQQAYWSLLDQDKHASAEVV